MMPEPLDMRVLYFFFFQPRAAVQVEGEADSIAANQAWGLLSL